MFYHSCGVNCHLNFCEVHSKHHAYYPYFRDLHDEVVMTWKYSLHYLPFVPEIHRSPVHSLQKGGESDATFWSCQHEQDVEQQSGSRWFETPWRSYGVTVIYFRQILAKSTHSIMSIRTADEQPRIQLLFWMGTPSDKTAMLLAIYLFGLLINFVGEWNNIIFLEFYEIMMKVIMSEIIILHNRIHVIFCTPRSAMLVLPLPMPFCQEPVRATKPVIPWATLAICQLASVVTHVYHGHRADSWMKTFLMGQLWQHPTSVATRLIFKWDPGAKLMKSHLNIVTCYGVALLVGIIYCCCHWSKQYLKYTRKA